MNIRNVSSLTVDIDKNDSYIKCDCTSGNKVATLPLASDAKSEVTITKTDVSSYTVTVCPQRGETLDGATLQVETATVIGAITGSGNATVVVTAAGMDGSPITLSVPVLSGDAIATTAEKIRNAFRNNAVIGSPETGLFSVSGSAANIVLTQVKPTGNDTTLNISIDNGTCTGLTTAATSASTTAGVAVTITFQNSKKTFAPADSSWVVTATTDDIDSLQGTSVPMTTTVTRPIDFRTVPAPTSLLNKEFAYYRADIDTAYDEAVSGEDGFTVGMFRAYVGANQGGVIIEGIRAGVNVDASVVISDGLGAGYIAGARLTTYVPATANVKTMYGVIVAPRHDSEVAAIAGSLYTGLQIYLKQATAQQESRGLDIFTEASGAAIIYGIDIRGNTKYITGIHIAQGSIDTCGITIGEFVSAAASGGGFAVTATKSAAMRVYAESTADLTSAAMVRSILGRFLVTGAITQNAECFGVVGQLVTKASTLCHDSAGVLGTFEVQGTHAHIDGTGGDHCIAAVLGRVGVTVTATVIEANGILAGLAAMSNITDGYVSITNGGVLAGIYVGRFASKQVWDYGIYMDPNSISKVFCAGSSSSPVVCDTASAKFLQFYLDSGAGSGTSVGMYIREYLTGAGGSNAVMRVYSDVVNVAAATAQGIQCSLGFGESTTSGSVTGLGVAGRFQIGLADLAYPGTGTLAVIQSEIYSFGDASDPAGNNIAMFGVVNDGTALGMADVDDDAVLFHLRGWTSGTAHLYSKAQTPAAISGNVTYTLKVKLADGNFGYIPVLDTAVTSA